MSHRNRSMDHIIEQIDEILPRLDVGQLTKVLKHVEGYDGKKSKHKGPISISPKTLESIAENNLSYVIWMLNSTAMHQSDSQSKDEKRIENNAFLESFLVHARILIEFLYHGPTDEDTILAEHYVKNWDTYKNEDDQPSTEYLKDEKRRMDKLLAHLTEKGSMSKGEHKKWKRRKICDEINKKIIYFLDAPDNKISEEIKSQIRASTGPQGLPHDDRSKVAIGVTGQSN